MPTKSRNTDRALSVLDQYLPSERLAEIYDEDEDLVSALIDAIPGFEYPNYSWMTVAQVKTHLVAAA